MKSIHKNLILNLAKILAAVIVISIIVAFVVASIVFLVLSTLAIAGLGILLWQSVKKLRGCRLCDGTGKLPEDHFIDYDSRTCYMCSGHRVVTTNNEPHRIYKECSDHLNRLSTETEKIQQEIGRIKANVSGQAGSVREETSQILDEKVREYEEEINLRKAAQVYYREIRHKICHIAYELYLIRKAWWAEKRIKGKWSRMSQVDYGEIFANTHGFNFDLNKFEDEVIALEIYLKDNQGLSLKI